MDVQWMKLKEWLEYHIKEKDGRFCSFEDIVNLRGMKKVLEKMEELEKK